MRVVAFFLVVLLIGCTPLLTPPENNEPCVSEYELCWIRSSVQTWVALQHTNHTELLDPSIRDGTMRLWVDKKSHPRPFEKHPPLSDMDHDLKQLMCSHPYSFAETTWSEIILRFNFKGNIHKFLIKDPYTNAIYGATRTKEKR